MTKFVEQNESTSRNKQSSPLRAGSGDVAVEPRGASPTDRLPELCDRVRQLAAATADKTLAAAQEQADRLIAAASAQSESDYQTQIAKVREQLERQQNRELQNERMAARTRIDKSRWDELTQVRDEAERFVERLREEDQARYYGALLRFVKSARAELASDQIVVQVGANDVEPIRMQLADDTIEIVAAECTVGVVVGTPDGNVVVDHSIQRRRQRLESQLLLAARKILFDESLSE